MEDKPYNVVWLKDNKPLEDPLQDRMTFKEGEHNTYTMTLIHCRESDSGIYIAKATNGFEHATCTAQLIVEKCKICVNIYIQELIFIFLLQ